LEVKEEVLDFLAVEREGFVVETTVDFVGACVCGVACVCVCTCFTSVFLRSGPLAFGTYVVLPLVTSLFGLVEVLGRAFCSGIIGDGVGCEGGEIV